MKAKYNGSSLLPSTFPKFHLFCFVSQTNSETALAENRKEWKKKKSTALENEMTWLEYQGIDICFDMHGAEANQLAETEADAD